MDSSVDVSAEAEALISHLADRCSRGEPLGSMSASIYCTAWVSMIQKPTDGGRSWLFPQAFQYVLDKQSLKGSWGHGSLGTNDVDIILNTMAALLSVLKHRNEAKLRGYDLEIADLDGRIKSGTACLKQKLEHWDVARTEHVAFEILIPTHLSLLHLEGVEFQFTGLKKLTELNTLKMAKFMPEFLYGTPKTTMIHSMEAFVGKIDFDRLKHRLEEGSMMYLPSSTAAYLMNVSAWDDEAEAYLRMVLDKSEVSGSGGFPAAYPSEVFEIGWVLSTLLGAGFTQKELGSTQVDLMVNRLELIWNHGDGTIGFTSEVMPDADDTAKSLSSLYILGRHRAKPDRLIKTFDSGTSFQTYQAERNPSFSANCNVLIALLQSPDSRQYTETVYRIVDYLCTAWFAGSIRDKSNASEQYSYMLLAQGLALTLSLWDRQMLGYLPVGLVRDRVSLVLVQILSRTLLNQQHNSSWGSGSCEITAYGILTLKSLVSIPFISSMNSEISAAMETGRQYLLMNHNRWAEPSYIWVGKVSYGSTVLSQTYCFAAMHKSQPITAWSGALTALVDPPIEKSVKFIQFFSRLPLYSHLGKGNPTLKLSVLEGYLLLPRLRAVRLDIFPRKGMAEDRWLEYIPLTWMCCNYLNSPVNTELLIEMMLLSMLNYQLDEYMEAVVGVHFSDKPEIIRALIYKLCAEPSVSSSLLPLKRRHEYLEFGGPNDTNNSIGRNYTATKTSSTKVTNNKLISAADTDLSGVEEVLTKYVAHVRKRPFVLRATPRARSRLRRELATFLSAHVTQNSDNALFAEQLGAKGSKSEPNRLQPFADASSSFHQWVCTTSADHTSGPFSWVFYECLIGNAGTETWVGAKRSYLAEEVGRRLSTICRMYNDYGSAKRDRAEMNVNSLDFPEFFDSPGMGIEEEEANRRKTELMYLAEYERECLNRALECLGEMVEREILDKVWLFVNVTDLFGQIYVARDIASRMK